MAVDRPYTAIGGCVANNTAQFIIRLDLMCSICKGLLLKLGRMKHIGLICLTLPMMFLKISAFECGGPDIWSNQLALSLMVGSTTMRCGILNLTKQRWSCNVLTEEDEKNLICGGSEQDSNCNMPINLCPDGSLNKTCFPVADSNSLHYMCLCHSALHHQIDNGITATWSPWQMMSISHRQFTFSRKLYSSALEGCLIQEYETDPPKLPEIVNIVAEYNLPDSVFSASSTAGSGHEPHRARIDAYFTWSCAWAGGSYNIPWLQIHLPSSYIFVVTGVLIKQRCDYAPQYVTAIMVKTSEEALQWQDVIGSTDIRSLYDAFDGQQSATVLFPISYTTPIWRIYVTAYNSHASMKCDLKGYGNA